MSELSLDFIRYNKTILEYTSSLLRLCITVKWYKHSVNWTFIPWKVDPPSLNVFTFYNSIVVQSLSRVWLFATPWTAARHAILPSTISQSLLKFMSIESVMLSNHLILCCHILLLPSILPRIRVFSNELVLCIRAKVLELQHQSFQWIFRVDFL